jgi:hypothetical protein
MSRRLTKQYIEYYDNGNIKMLGTCFLNGTKDGLFQSFYKVDTTSPKASNTFYISDDGYISQKKIKPIFKGKYCEKPLKEAIKNSGLNLLFFAILLSTILLYFSYSWNSYLYILSAPITFFTVYGTVDTIAYIRRRRGNIITKNKEIKNHKKQNTIKVGKLKHKENWVNGCLEGN